MNARDAILITESFPIDPPGPRIIYCNASFTRMTGHTEAEVLGQTPRIFQGADTDRATLDRLRTALERSEGVELELLNYTKAGASFWVELSIVPVWNQGQLTHWVSIQRDISERKTAGETAIRARIAEARNQALAAEIEERKRVEAQLAYTAFYDDLTKLHNRAFLMDRLRSMLVQVRIRRPFGFALLFADLDRFKIVNDSLGHQVGDELLRAVASRLQACIRPQDTMARVGGDEFAILIDDADTEVALQIAERILETLKTPLQLKDHQMFSSCSIGIVEASGRVLEAEDLLRDADIAMYQVKKAGGRGYAVFTESMHAAALTTLELQTEVRLALERGELRVHYQALMRTGDAGVAGFEALVRWEHPQRGLVLPSLFIPAAEEIGLVRQIGRWVLRHACEQLRAWHLRYPDQELRLSVNVSGSELQDDLFVDHLRQVLDTTGVAARSLELEITESVLLAQPEAVAGLLEQIREFGVRIALDDFGTGYSSLSYLDRYPLDTIKVDRSFVSALPVQKRTLAIAETIVRLGHALDLEVVAEGVETADQLGAVVSLGCDYVQGFYYSRPLPAAEAEVLLDKAQTKR